MTAREIDAGPLVAAAGALLLLVSLFLDWFGDATAWTVFEVHDLLLAAIAAAMVAGVAARLRGREIVPGRVVPVLGALAALIVASQLVNPPPAAGDAPVSAGGWLALAGSLLMLVGAYMAHARLALAVSVRERAEAVQPIAQEPRTDPAAETQPLDRTHL